MKKMVNGAAVDMTAEEEAAFEAARAPGPAPVPSEVTMRQARLALHAAGLLSSVESAIDAMDEPAKTAARIEWDYSNSLKRGNATLAALASALGLSSAQLDALFVDAGTR